MKAKDKTKLVKALEMIKKANSLINEVVLNDYNYKYDLNSNFRNADINRLISILEQDVKHN